jgi:hypothetical protein
MRGPGYKIELISLKCPNCSNALPSGERDTVFYCPECCRAWEVNAKSLIECPVSFASPIKPAEGDIIYLPFWRFDAKVSITDERPALMKLIEKLNSAWVSAFPSANVSIIGDPAIVYTSRPAEFRPEPSKKVTMKNCARSRAIALDFARIFLMDAVDRHFDISEIGLEVEISGGQLVGVPYYRSKDKLFDGLTGLQFPMNYME